MLYTVVSSFDVYYEEYKPDDYIDISGREIEYIRVDKNKQIMNLFSTNPSAYLNKKFSPGSRYL